VFNRAQHPLSMAKGRCIAEHLQTSAQLIAGKAGTRHGALVSSEPQRAPQDPWLEPDVREYLRREHASGLRAASIAGGVCLRSLRCCTTSIAKPLEVCAGTRHANGLAPRASNDDPLFLDMMARVGFAPSRRRRQCESPSTDRGDPAGFARSSSR